MLKNQFLEKQRVIISAFLLDKICPLCYIIYQQYDYCPCSYLRAISPKGGIKDEQI